MEFINHEHRMQVFKALYRQFKIVRELVQNSGTTNGVHWEPSFFTEWIKKASLQGLKDHSFIFNSVGYPNCLVVDLPTDLTFDEVLQVVLWSVRVEINLKDVKHNAKALVQHVRNGNWPDETLRWEEMIKNYTLSKEVPKKVYKVINVPTFINNQASFAERSF
jgi:hypothetical protein